MPNSSKDPRARNAGAEPAQARYLARRRSRDSKAWQASTRLSPPPPSTQVKQRFPFDQYPIYVTDEQIGRVLLGSKHWKAFLTSVPALEKEGLPPRRATFLGRRHLPAVLRFFEMREIGESFDWQAEDGQENFD